MAAVKIADILTPEVWRQYGEERTAEKSAFWESGIVATIPGLELPRGGATVNLPFFGDLSGDLQTLDDNTPLAVNKIGAAKQVGVLVGRGNAWGVNDLAALLAGADPAKALIDRLAGYWARQFQAELLATLGGVFGAASMATNVHDVTGVSAGSTTINGYTGQNQSFNAFTYLDAVQKLGDSKSAVSAIAMHSATEAYLAKQQLIQYAPTAGSNDRVGTYMGKRVIVDDGLPQGAGNYTTYIFGPGAVGFSVAPVGNGDTETDRDILAGENVLTMRRRWILHVKGSRWQGTPAGDFPTRTELGVGTNWLRVFESKNIPVVQFKHKLV